LASKNEGFMKVGVTKKEDPASILKDGSTCFKVVVAEMID
jgi:hypothetical protein